MKKDNLLIKRLQEIAQETLFSREIQAVEMLLNEIRRDEAQRAFLELRIKLPDAPDFATEIKAMNEIADKVTFTPIRITIRYSEVLNSQSATCMGFENGYDILLPYSLFKQLTEGLKADMDEWTPEMKDAEQQLRQLLYHELGHILSYSKLDNLEELETKDSVYSDDLKQIFTRKSAE